MLRHGYLELFAEDPAWLPRAKALAARTYELTEFLVDVLGVLDLGAHYPGPLTYHPSCHSLRGMDIDRQPKALLGKVLEEGNAQAALPEPAQFISLPHADECYSEGFSVEHPKSQPRC
jgi:L-lactate dehydrogenase complex protein LldE